MCLRSHLHSHSHEDSDPLSFDDIKEYKISLKIICHPDVNMSETYKTHDMS